MCQPEYLYTDQVSACGFSVRSSLVLITMCAQVAAAPRRRALPAPIRHHAMVVARTLPGGRFREVRSAASQAAPFDHEL